MPVLDTSKKKSHLRVIFLPYHHHQDCYAGLRRYKDQQRAEPSLFPPLLLPFALGLSLIHMGDADEARRPGGGEGTAAPSGSPLLLDPGRERRYAELFQQLDLNNDGKVDIGELRTALAARGLNQGDAEEVRDEGGGGAMLVVGAGARTHTKPPTRELIRRRSASVLTFHWDQGDALQ